MIPTMLVETAALQTLSLSMSAAFGPLISPGFKVLNKLFSLHERRPSIGIGRLCAFAAAFRTILAGFSLLAPQLAEAQTPGQLQAEVQAVLAAAPPGTRFGLLVEDGQGREVVAIDPEQRFIPASNTKLFTTAAALALLGNTTGAITWENRTSVGLVKHRKGLPDVVLTGRGAVFLSTSTDCATNCLAAAADAVAAQTHRVNDIIADDTWLPDQRWSPGMSWNNIGTDDGTATSALVVDDNQVPVIVAPGSAGAPALISITPYLTAINEVVTVATGKTSVAFEPAINGRTVRVFGTILAGSPPLQEKLGIDDPAEYAAWQLGTLLTARKVRIFGQIKVRHRPVASRSDVAARPDLQVPAQGYGTILDYGDSGLVADVLIVNKRSQNLHAELLLRRIGRIMGTGSLADGLALEIALFSTAGITRAGFDFSDGSGMSTYNRVSPRATVALLRWGKSQPWGQTWIDSLPVAGIDGTMRRRFVGTPLVGKLRAKSGTLNATSALSGFMRAASGRELTFSIYANDVPDGASAVPAIDQALVLIAARN